MVTVSDVEYIRERLLHVFPDAVRGSVAKSNWGRGRKQLHLSYWIAPHTVGGLIAHAVGDLVYLVQWDTNSGHERLFAESDVDVFIERVIKKYEHKTYTINRTISTALSKADS